MKRPKRVRALFAALALTIAGCSYLLDTDSLSSGVPSPTAEGGAADAVSPQDALADADADADVAADGAADAPTLDVRTALVAEWLFDDVGADAAVDTTGHGHVGQLVGTAVLALAGKRNGALVVDGGGKVAATSLDYVAFPRSGTITLWVYVDPPATDAGVRMLFDTYDGTRDHVFMRQLPSGNGMTLQVADQWNDGGYAAEFRPELTPGAWTHVALTWDEAAKESRIFVDGVDRARHGWTPPFAPTQQLVRIGDGFIGRVDEVRLYDRPLTAAEIAAQM